MVKHKPQKNNQTNKKQTTTKNKPQNNHTKNIHKHKKFIKVNKTNNERKTITTTTRNIYLKQQKSFRIIITKSKWFHDNSSASQTDSGSKRITRVISQLKLIIVYWIDPSTETSGDRPSNYFELTIQVWSTVRIALTRYAYWYLPLLQCTNSITRTQPTRLYKRVLIKSFYSSKS